MAEVLPEDDSMLIEQASEILAENVIGGAVFETSDNDWIYAFASELGIVMLLIAGLFSVVTRPFRTSKPKLPGPFSPHEGLVYLAITETHTVFFSMPGQLSEILAKHPRSRNLSITRKGRAVSLQIEPETTYHLFWRDTQFAWEHVEGLLNTGRSPHLPSQAS